MIVCVLEQTMRIDKLHLQNFRCFEDRRFVFSGQFNVLVGDNGTGKTTIIHALSMCLDNLIEYIDMELQTGGEGYTSHDVRLAIHHVGQSFAGEKQYPSQIHCAGQFNNQVIDSKVSVLRETQYHHVLGEHSEFGATLQTRQLFDNLGQKVQAGEITTLPLVAYYGVSRFADKDASRSVEQVEHNGNPKRLRVPSRLDGYTSCFLRIARVKNLLTRFATYQAQSNQLQTRQGTKLLAFETLQRAILRFMPEVSEVFYDFLREDLYFLFSDGREFAYQWLSDGQRGVLGLVADIVLRAIDLNPHLEDMVVSETAGVVLIDELDLHLHPSWQRRIVEDLRRTFPKIQFVVTTHSPFIIQSLRPGELINLNQTPPAEYADESIEDIVENVQGIRLPQKSQRYQAMVEAAKNYYQVLEQAPIADGTEVTRLKNKLDELSAPFIDNPAYLAFLESKRESAGLRGNGHEAS